MPAKKGLRFTKTILERIMYLDPLEFYQRAFAFLDPFKRTQGRIPFDALIPITPDGICDCGCDKPLTGRRRRWATDQCSMFIEHIWQILYGNPRRIKTYIKKYHGNHCSVCGADGRQVKLQLEHTVPVKLGGGACWLNNFSLMCLSCHAPKTKLDLIAIRAFKKKKK